MTLIRDFKHACRFCLQCKNAETQDLLQLKSLYDYTRGRNGKKNIAEIFTATIAGMIISPTDELSQLICGNCLEKVLDVQEFQEMCKASEASIRRLIEHKSHKQDSVSLDHKSDSTDGVTGQCIVEVKDELEFFEDENTCSGTGTTTTVIVKEELDIVDDINWCGTVAAPSDDREMTNDKQQTDEKRYKCDQCAKCFTQARYLQNHRRTHSDEKSYKCEHCERSFAQQSTLIAHLRGHFGDEIYQCNYCPLGFGLLAELRRHIRSEHMDEEDVEKRERNLIARKEKDEKIKFMLKEKSLMAEKSTQKYMRVSKNVKCEHCDKRFTRNYGLRKHLRTHTGEKPYHCVYCVMRFAQSETLRKHLRTHKAYNLVTHLREHPQTEEHQNEEIDIREENFAAR